MGRPIIPFGKGEERGGERLFLEGKRKSQNRQGRGKGPQKGVKKKARVPFSSGKRAEVPNV